MRQVVAAQMRGDGGRHVGRRRRAARTVAETFSAIAAEERDAPFAVELAARRE